MGPHYRWRSTTGHGLSMLESAKTMVELTRKGPMYENNIIVEKVIQCISRKKSCQIMIHSWPWELYLWPRGMPINNLRFFNIHVYSFGQEQTGGHCLVDGDTCFAFFVCFIQDADMRVFCVVNFIPSWVDQKWKLVNDMHEDNELVKCSYGGTQMDRGREEVLDNLDNWLLEF